MKISSSDDISRIFANLGEHIRHKYTQANCSPEALPSIAASALADLDIEFSFNASLIADFLASTRISQQPELAFSNLPITVYRCLDFYIEILTWTQATTTIHQHGFSGAFKVLQGSSVHTRYTFRCERSISADCLIGSVNASHTEYLGTGSTQTIDPGPLGLVHSLYHLENPSLTLVVRSYGHGLYQPQYTIYPPGLALNPFHYGADEMILMYQRLLKLAASISREDAHQVWVQQVAKLDFGRMSYLYLKNLALFSDTAEHDRFLNAAQEMHADLVESVKAASLAVARQQRISETRQVLTDPELRFFLALLMTASDRLAVIKLVTERYPDRDALRTIASWLATLSEARADTARQLKEMLKGSKIGAQELWRKLGHAVPSELVGTPACEQFFQAFLDQTSEKQGCSSVAREDLVTDREDWRRAFARMAEFEELHCLF
jgi:hypothetical protein